jgi:hypothetical protein
MRGFRESQIRSKSLDVSRITIWLEGRNSSTGSRRGATGVGAAQSSNQTEATEMDEQDAWSPSTSSAAEKTRKSSLELLHSTLDQWADLYGKRLSKEAIEVWMRIFVNTDARILAPALLRVTESSERMPTPGNLSKAIAIEREKLGFAGQPGERKCACLKCEGTGWEIVDTKQHFTVEHTYHQAKRCGCHPQHAQVRAELEAIDDDGTPCWIDARTGEYLYRADDCPEGREFLAKLRQVAGKMALT